VIDSREQLIHLLTEAAEVEHNLLCSYLYAAFSLKRAGEEGRPVEAAVDLDGVEPSGVALQAGALGRDMSRDVGRNGPTGRCDPARWPWRRRPDPASISGVCVGGLHAAHQRTADGPVRPWPGAWIGGACRAQKL
jgi:hypothetical protein